MINDEMLQSPLLEVDQLSFLRAKDRILDNISCHYDSGEFIGLLGPNGAGKSTFMRSLAGFIKPSAGDVLLANQAQSKLSPTQRAQLMAYVPQQTAFAFPYTVERIVQMGRLPHTGLNNINKKYHIDAVTDAMSQMGLEPLSNRKVTELSGGERQRVLIARALAQTTPILMLDEPMSNLDYGFQLRLMALLEKRAQEGTLIIMTSHRPEELFASVSRIQLLKDGKLMADGKPSSILTADRLSKLYGIELSHSDHADRRYFHPSK